MPQNFPAPQTEAPASMDDDRYIAFYEALPPRAKLVLHLKAIAGPYVEKDGLFKAASAAQILLPDGKALTSATIGEIVGLAKRNGLWNRLARRIPSSATISTSPLSRTRNAMSCSRRSGRRSGAIPTFFPTTTNRSACGICGLPSI